MSMQVWSTGETSGQTGGRTVYILMDIIVIDL